MIPNPFDWYRERKRRADQEKRLVQMQSEWRNLVVNLTGPPLKFAYIDARAPFFRACEAERARRLHGESPDHLQITTAFKQGREVIKALNEQGFQLFGAFWFSEQAERWVTLLESHGLVDAFRDEADRIIVEPELIYYETCANGSTDLISRQELFSSV